MFLMMTFWFRRALGTLHVVSIIVFRGFAVHLRLFLPCAKKAWLSGGESWGRPI